MRKIFAVVCGVAFLSSGLATAFAGELEDEFYLMTYLQSLTAKEMSDQCSKRFPEFKERFAAVIGPWTARYKEEIRKGEVLYNGSIKEELNRTIAGESAKGGAGKDGVPDEKLRPACENYLHDLETELELK
jgi:hypothetical protein